MPFRNQLQLTSTVQPPSISHAYCEKDIPRSREQRNFSTWCLHSNFLRSLHLSLLKSYITLSILNYKIIKFNVRWFSDANHP
ncbi:hypothetical protein FGO68_gene5567 [Halteria grandinella]|uniref:Uncharacterized protein n=1 Tax=Halteria grandinella TaxID=5974 RepID=A0A8J8TAB8_HALGN|nr:hypothetical protein FGO68_gene5567 [Halteria grandinella]